MKNVEAISKDVYACFYFFSLSLSLSLTSTRCFLESLVSVCLYFFPPFFWLFLYKLRTFWRVYVNWHAHCNHVGVNVVCIDAVYKCCIKTSLTQGHKHLP